MELATKRSKPLTHANLRAVVTGRYVGDARALIRLLADDLVSALDTDRPTRPTIAIRDDSGTTPAAQRIAARLEALLIDESSPPVPSCNDTLPTARLSPEEVVKQTGMSKTTLYRADHAQFYSVVPTGMKNRRAYPAWQFTANVPAHMPRVLEILRSNTRLQVNAFFLSAQDALNELSPAEVLAGLPFEGHATLEAPQRRMLALPERTRVDKVIALAKQEVADPD